MAEFRVGVSLQPEGDWEVSAYWRFEADPKTYDAILVESSIGLNVVADPYLQAAEPQCLLRYDVDRRLGGTGPHLNVFQFRPLRDGVHFAVPGFIELDEWPLVPVMDYFLDDLPAQLSGLGW